MALKMSDRLQLFLTTVTVAICYYLGALFGLSLSFKPDYIAALWPPNAILLTALLLTPPKNWIYYLLAIVPAELLADLPSGIPLNMALGFIAADWIEVLAAAALLGKFSTLPPQFSTLKQTTAYFFCCVLIAPLIAAFPGAVITGLHATGPEYMSRWFRWFMSDALTHLILTPFFILLVTWRTNQPLFRSRRSRLEFWTLFTLIAVSGLLAFSCISTPALRSPALMYLPFPFALLATFRFGLRGVFSAALILTILGIYSASHGYGLFASNPQASNVIHLQILLMISITPLVFLASVVIHLKQTGAVLKERELQYRTLFQNNKSVILIIDPKTGAIVDANPSACAYYGYSIEVLKKMNMTDINTLSKEEVLEEMENAKSEKRNYFSFKHRLANREIHDVEVYSGPIPAGGGILLCSIIHDISKRRIAEQERERLIVELQKALSEVKTLRGFLPICASCKKIRDDKGYWNQIEAYISDHSEAEFSHSICPDCAKKLYPDFDRHPTPDIT